MFLRKKEMRIEIDLDEYKSAYAESKFVLDQYYPSTTVKSLIYGDKKSFLEKEIKKEIGGHVFIKGDVIKK